jgi:hypothetical protein
MTDRTDEHPGRRDQRPPSGDGADRCVTSGAKSGTSGGFSNWRAWLAVLGLVALNAFVNVMTALDDARRRGIELPVTRVAVEEISSAVAATIAAFVIFAAVRLAPPGRGPLWRTIAVHAGGTLVFSGLHTALMILLRTVVFAAMRQPYAWVWGQVPYEYRKDLIAYLVIGGLFWALTRREREIPPALETPRTAGPATFDIRDGVSILRVPLGEILAAKAAGNYVEFVLEDGRRPLMRASMAQIEAALGSAGFVRTHRSWLVNAERVRALSSAGSGDFRLDLGSGLIAPLSRRYRNGDATTVWSRLERERSAADPRVDGTATLH